MQTSNIFDCNRIIDFHVHVFPDEVAERAVGTLLKAYGVEAITDGTITGLLGHMSKSGVGYSIIQPVATKPGQVRSINDWAASHSDPRIISFGGIHPDYRDIQVEIDRIISLGLRGIKIQANWQDVYIDEERMHPIYEAAQGRLIMMFHCGDELAPVTENKANPRRLATIRKEFPNLTIIAAHMGGYLMWDEMEEYLLGTDIYFDTSACFPQEFPDERFVDTIRRHGPEKILFGTDSPFGDACESIPRFLKMGLTDAELEMIFWQNGKRLLGDKAAI